MAQSDRGRALVSRDSFGALFVVVWSMVSFLRLDVASLLLVVRPGDPSSVLAPSSDARSP